MYIIIEKKVLEILKTIFRTPNGFLFIQTINKYKNYYQNYFFKTIFKIIIRITFQVYSKEQDVDVSMIIEFIIFFTKFNEILNKEKFYFHLLIFPCLLLLFS